MSKKEKNKIKNKKFFRKKKILQIFLVCLVLFIFSGNFAEAATSFNLKSLVGGELSLKDFGIGLFNTLLYGILLISIALFTLAKNALTLMLDAKIYEQVFFSGPALAALNEAWRLVRDFLNMFFILVILLIAIGTILRVEKFSYKTHLFQIILAAILINFSKAITLAVIDVSQLAMGFFLKGITNGANIITGAAGLGDMWKDITVETTGAYTVGIFLTIAFLLIMAFMFFLLAIALIVRIVAFYVLIILSPLAMFGIALKGLGASNMTSDWIKKLTSWAFFGPIMLFFLWIAMTLVGVLNKLTVNSSSFGEMFNSLGQGEIANAMGSFSKMLVPYISAIYLLFYGFDLSRKISVGAAAGILNWGDNKMKSWGKKGLKYAGYGALGTVATGMTFGLAPLAYLAARKYGLGSKFKGFRDKDREGKLNPLKLLKSKAKRKEELDKKKKGWEARGKGKDEYNKYMRGEVASGLKDLKDKGGINKDIAEKMLKSKDEKERKMGAKWLAEEGKVGSENMESVMKAVGNDSVLAGQIRESGSKKNESAFIDFDIQNALAAKDLEAEAENNATLKNLTKDRKDGETRVEFLKKNYPELFSEDGKLNKNKFTEAAYDDLVDRKGEGVLDQNKDAFKNGELSKSLNKKMKENPRFAKEVYKKFAKKSSQEQQAIRAGMVSAGEQDEFAKIEQKEREKEKDEQDKRLYEKQIRASGRKKLREDARAKAKKIVNKRPPDGGNVSDYTEYIEE